MPESKEWRKSPCFHILANEIQHTGLSVWTGLVDIMINTDIISVFLRIAHGDMFLLSFNSAQSTLTF